MEAKLFLIISILFAIVCPSLILSFEYEPNGVLVKAARDSQVGRLGLPKCKCANLDCSCCFQANLLKSPPVCVRAIYKVNELTMAVDIEVDGKRVGGRSVGPDAVPFCMPAAPLYICLAANSVFFSNETAKACFKYTVKFVGGSELYTGNFPCFHMENGKLGLSFNKA